MRLPRIELLHLGKQQQLAQAAPAPACAVGAAVAAGALSWDELGGSWVVVEPLKLRVPHCAHLFSTVRWPLCQAPCSNTLRAAAAVALSFRPQYLVACGEHAPLAGACPIAAPCNSSSVVIICSSHMACNIAQPLPERAGRKSSAPGLLGVQLSSAALSLLSCAHQVRLPAGQWLLSELSHVPAV